VHVVPCSFAGCGDGLVQTVDQSLGLGIARGSGRLGVGAGDWRYNRPLLHRGRLLLGGDGVGEDGSSGQRDANENKDSKEVAGTCVSVSHLPGRPRANRRISMIP
jgi:hypothetical protein